MGILSRAKNFVQNITALSSVNLRAVSIKNFEGFSEAYPNLVLGDDAIKVTEDSAQKLAIVYSCLNVLGETLGSLPCDVKQYSKTGPVTVYSNPVHRLIHDRPNAYTTAFSFWSAIAKLRKAHGNAYAEIERDQAFNPIALHIRHTDDVNVYVNNVNKEIYYSYKGRFIASRDMLHFKNYSLSYVVSISTL